MYNHDINLRSAKEDDIPAIGRLYAETVRNINVKDYLPGQIDVWSSSGDDRQRWKKHITEQYFVIAEISGEMAGFGSITPDGYLDFMYVSKDHQRMGAAKAILDEIERKAHEQKNSLIYSHVSITARGFFEKFGYQKVKSIEDPYKGVVFINNLMVKNYTGENLSCDIKTERTLLRRYTERDRKNSIRLSLDKDLMHFMGGARARDEKEAGEIFDKCFEIYRGWLGEKPLGTRRFELWGIEFEDRLIGHFELKESTNTQPGELEIVYLLDKDYWGKGLMPEAIRAVNEYANSTGSLVIATINPENMQTVRSLEKAGIEKQEWIGEGDDRVYKVWLK